MSQTTDDRFASLFVDLTGRHTVTERQRADDARRVQGDADRDVAEYVADAARQHGLDDAIEPPETTTE